MVRKKWFCAVSAALLGILSASAPAMAADTTIDLRVYNWGEYISNGEDGSLDVVKEFENRNPNIKVEYNTYASNEELYAKLRSGSANYDVIIPSDYMVSRMIQEDMLEKLDFDRLPNYEDVMDSFKNLEYDPTNEYSVPYTWGTVGIIYNTKMVDEPVTSWDILWDPDYMGNILMFNNSRDAFGIALKRMGYSQNTTDPEILDQAAEDLKEQKQILQSYVMDEIFDKMSNGEAALAPYYAGDALTMIEDNPDLAFVVPEEGSNRFVDAMVIPKGVRHKEAAEDFINFMMEPEIALANIEYLGYSTPMQSVYDQLDEEVIHDGISYPSEDILDKCDTFINLPEETNQYIQELWVDILASGSSSVWELVFLFAVILGLGGVAIFYLRKRKKGY
ncbi:MAG: ABC transporter substrate-binding protein [Massiliimalia sp.]|jgi:spermidine/putrescine transport system substrate-binding protein